VLAWLVRAAVGLPFHQRRSRRHSKKISTPLRRFGPGADPRRENGARRVAPGNWRSRTARSDDHVAGWWVPLDSPKLYDFYETVCALDVPVFVHPALVPTGYEHLKDYDLPRVLGREVDLTVATTRLIAGGIFDRVPNLKIVMAHFGGGIAAVKDRLIGKGYRFGTLNEALRRVLR
jgi:predicted TIM-barrel fold metal-dependent hydrolase